MGEAKGRRRARGPIGGGTAATRRRGREPRLTRARPRTVVGVTTSMLGLSSTRRAVVLALVVCAVALTVVVPLRNYVVQRQELAAVQGREQALQQDVAALTTEQQRLQAPAEVEAQARTRLGYAMPGEVPYVVQLPAAGSDPTAGGPAGAPWYRTLWREVSVGAP